MGRPDGPPPSFMPGPRGGPGGPAPWRPPMMNQPPPNMPPQQRWQGPAQVNRPVQIPTSAGGDSDAAHSHSPTPNQQPQMEIQVSTEGN